MDERNESLPTGETMSEYQFEKCMEPGCTDDATFITLVGSDLKCYCDAHGVTHGLDRGIPVAPGLTVNWSEIARELGERGQLTSDMLLENQKSFSPKVEELKYPDRPCDIPYHSA